MMNSMKCFQCVLKHVSACLSYGKEILSGHGKDSDLDHRIDFLGELVNLEHHLELIDKNLFVEVKNFRQQMQSKQENVNQADLQYLRQLFIKVQNAQTSTNSSEQKQTEINSIPSVLFLHIQDKNYFDLAYRKLKENLSDYDKIYCLKSDIDLSEYDVEKIDYKNIENEYVYVINEKDIILRSFSAKNLLRIQDYKANFKYGQIIQELKENKPYFYYDDFPALVKKDDFQEYLNRDYPLTFYCNKNKADVQYKPFQVALKLNQVLCCSNKGKIKSAFYCYLENEVALNSVKAYFDGDKK